MEVKIISKKQNQLFGRSEVVASITGFNATPSRKEVVPLLCTELKCAAEALILRKAGVKVKVLGRNEIEKAGMGGLAGVSRGSANEPQFIIAEWRGRGRETVLERGETAPTKTR